ncbi:MAG TPA: DUF3616 domain-containing protein [Accumulibacter sp.]|nr:DUF3616 domain-containing protein [Accumulibacter sp.]HMW17829.1 DUF3616 domain-containing protein [Accumulibacter sp.]HMX23288.1 DUF3616 domain-containing protein [Accumulibacter sp.]HMY07511.1 DUF3616 domain-containing protein [Accumulibacter sp.]HNC17938.1 DUF3616 domain-containing protein [Accumulibacter sp.]
MTFATLVQFQELTGFYEPSGIAQLADGRFLIVEDERKHALSVLSLQGGRVERTELDEPFWSWGQGDFWDLDDLEGVTADSAGFIYAITSHSRDDQGKAHQARERLVRFRLDGDKVKEPKVVDHLKRALTDAHPVLAAAAEIRHVKRDGGLNIEGLAFSADRRQLLIGFRSPLLDGQAIIAGIYNVSAIFDDDVRPQISELITVDLGGKGLRGLSHVPFLAGYLLIAGPIAREQVDFELWFWDGDPGHAPRRVTVPGLPGFRHAEGVAPAIIDGQPRLIIVSDEGDRQDDRFARYLLLSPEQLHIA